MVEQPDNALIFETLKSLRGEVASLRSEVNEATTKIDERLIGVARDVSGLSRHLRHHDADLEDIEKRLDLLET